MPEINEQQTQRQPKLEICSIRIMFPVKSDEEAITYKKKVSMLLAEIPEAQIQFSLMTPPSDTPFPIK